MVEEPDGKLGSLPISIWSTCHLPSLPRSNDVHPTIRTFSHMTTNQQVTDDTHKTFSMGEDSARCKDPVQTYASNRQSHFEVLDKQWGDAQDHVFLSLTIVTV